MEFLGKSVSSRFGSFYADHVAPYIPSVELTYHAIPEGAASIRGGGHVDFGYTYIDRMSPETAEVHVRTGLPESEFEGTLAL